MRVFHSGYSLPVEVNKSMAKLTHTAAENVFLDPLDEEAEIERRQTVRNLEMMLDGKSWSEIRGEQLKDDDDRHYRGEEMSEIERENNQPSWNKN